jgi:ABC-type uncharacterized transport system substrate-binding protein
MIRREFIAAIGSTIAVLIAARALQSERVRRIGVLMPLAKDTPEARARIATFLQELQRLGWTDGRNLQIEYRWETGGDPSLNSKAATELVTLSPEVILATATPAVTALQHATRTVPIVFAQVADPVAIGIVASLAKPGGNMTGFTNISYDISAKWLELLKEIAPHVTRIGVVRDPTLTANIGQYAAIQSAARAFGVEVIALGGRGPEEIERSVTEFARDSNSGLSGSNGGLISIASPLTVNNRVLIISLAARHRLPAVYSCRCFVAGGGLISYEADSIDVYRQAAGYVDRILKGEKPADLPVQGAKRFELAINLKTAGALGLTVPPLLHSRANEIID